MKEKFKVGQRVVFANPCEFDDDKDSPHWGGKYGKVVGTIESTDRSDSCDTAIVLWDNGKKRSLRQYRLQPYNLRFKFSKWFENYNFKSYKSYIGVAALLMVIDYFVLNGRIQKAIASAFDRTIDRIFKRIIDLPEA